jgi:hypothetical protein
LISQHLPNFFFKETHVLNFKIRQRMNERGQRTYLLDIVVQGIEFVGE